MLLNPDFQHCLPQLFLAEFSLQSYLLINVLDRGVIDGLSDVGLKL